ncbi:GntR family transcriptional regulator [Sinorhizobium meliloti]|uniref:GntR family transcriptional regulator n=1 Tax=Rhizobium meliloti TaxID=382 RepID=UPI001296B4E3|nr:GntR family transcriptional regulator [Sinorhizobium meliloti]MQX41869.1 FCD domain-containing protein [Sinorhizobium meliloti]MQX55039.1 FCD domain-containing protein [Sinorhizobium meliloti]
MDKPEKTLPNQRFASDSLEDQAYRQIRRALVEGDFAPGQKMPIRGIASELGTSPMPVRTALRRLISEQALDVLPSGTAIVPRLTRSSFAKLGMVRAALEPLAVKMAASNLDRSTQERLAELLQKEQNARASGDPVQLLRADRQFLLALYEHCQTPMLLAMIEATWLRRGPHFWEARWLIIGRSPSGSKHADILRAVASQDSDGAAQILKEEIEGTTSYLLERMSFADDQVAPGRLRPIRRK